MWLWHQGSIHWKDPAMSASSPQRLFGFLHVQGPDGHDRFKRQSEGDFSVNWWRRTQDHPDLFIESPCPVSKARWPLYHTWGRHKPVRCPMRRRQSNGEEVHGWWIKPQSSMDEEELSFLFLICVHMHDSMSLALCIYIYIDRYIDRWKSYDWICIRDWHQQYVYIYIYIIYMFAWEHQLPSHQTIAFWATPRLRWYTLRASRRWSGQSSPFQRTWQEATSTCALLRNLRAAWSPEKLDWVSDGFHMFVAASVRVWVRGPR